MSLMLTPPAADLPAVNLPAAPQDAGGLAEALVAGQLSPQTRRAYAADLAELLRVLDIWRLTLPQVTRDHLHLYRAWLAGEDAPGLAPRRIAGQIRACAPASVSRKVSVLRQFFAEAEGRGLIPANPAARLRGFQGTDQSKTAGLSRFQAVALLSAIDTATPLGLRDRAMLSLMLRTGLRRMDVRGATCGALGVHQGHQTLRVLSKGRKERVVKVPVDVARDLEAWRLAAQTLRVETAATPLFCGLKKSGRGPAARHVVVGDGQKPLAVNTLWDVVVRRAQAAGLDGAITPHSTRHTFITLALDGGAPLHKVQVAAGHADPRTTERYWRTQQNLDDNAVDYVHL